MSNPLVSVVIFTYNQENYIRQTIDSILEQQSSYPMEILIAEDCSTDSTREIVCSYAEKNAHIRPILNTVNKGLIRNYYETIQLCKGEYIALCAGDDYWIDPLKIQKQVDFLEANPSFGMVHTDCHFLDQKTGEYTTNQYISENNTFENLIIGSNIAALTLCFRRDLLNRYMKEVQPLEKDWKMEDYPFILWMSVNCKIKYVEDKTAVYRMLENSASRTTDPQKAYEFRASVWDIRLFFGSKYLSTQAYQHLYKRYITGLQWRPFAFKDVKRQIEIKQFYTLKQPFNYIITRFIYPLFSIGFIYGGIRFVKKSLMGKIN